MYQKNHLPCSLQIYPFNGRDLRPDYMMLYVTPDRLLLVMSPFRSVVLCAGRHYDVERTSGREMVGIVFALKIHVNCSKFSNAGHFAFQSPVKRPRVISLFAQVSSCPFDLQSSPLIALHPWHSSKCCS